MAKYELSDTEIKSLLAIIDGTTIKGKDAETVIKLKNKLNNPIKI